MLCVKCFCCLAASNAILCRWARHCSKLFSLSILADGRHHKLYCICCNLRQKTINTHPLNGFYLVTWKCTQLICDCVETFPVTFGSLDKGLATNFCAINLRFTTFTLSVSTRRHTWARSISGNGLNLSNWLDLPAVWGLSLGFYPTDQFTRPSTHPSGARTKDSRSPSKHITIKLLQKLALYHLLKKKCKLTLK